MNSVFTLDLGTKSIKRRYRFILGAALKSAFNRAMLVMYVVVLFITVIM